jgi:periplasmic protein TonB
MTNKFSNFLNSVGSVAKLAPIMPRRRLLLAFATSVFLHGLMFVGAVLVAKYRAQLPRPATVTPAMIEATLHPAAPDEPLLKDTLADEQAPPVPAEIPLPTPPAVAASSPPVPTVPTVPTESRNFIAKAASATQQKLAEHLYYPSEAVAAGLEGEVRLLVTLSETGKVLDAQVARGSGHAVLDQAAMRAAFAVGDLPGLDTRELILPVLFRLQP